MENLEQSLFDFTEKAFQYYNGRINPNIPAKLEVVKIKDLNDVRAAYTRYPNIVVIQPLNIYQHNCKFHHETRTMYHIVESVIHELYHMEQFLRYSRVVNPEYVTKIEADVDFMVASYVLGHLQELYHVFGVIVDSEMIEYLQCFKPYKNGLYERKTVFDHICLFVDSLFGNQGHEMAINRTIAKLIHYVEDVPNSIVSFLINGNCILIKDKDFYIDINDFNQKVYEYFSKYEATKRTEISESYNDTEYHIIITFDGGSNIMARKVFKENI